MMSVRVRDRDRADLGQFFLEDKSVLEKIVDLAAIQPDEVVLEIGAGDGRLTKLLSEKAKKVIAIEIDKNFEPDLKKLPKNIEVIIGDALELLSPKSLKKFNKIIANLPSTLVEPIFNRLTSIDFETAVFLVPEKFAYKLVNQPTQSAYFEMKLIDKVSKKSFSPVPRTNWEIVTVGKIAKPLENSRLDLFLSRFLNEHPNAKLKNSLMEGIIRFYVSKGKKLTKNQAREIITKAKIDKEILESLSAGLSATSEFIGKIKV